MTNIQRLDYSKPPPGHHGVAGGVVGVVGDSYVVVPLTTTWVHYKASNDPPGMEVRGEGGTDNAKRRRAVRWRIYTLGAAGSYRETRGIARLEAWGRYDRRLELAERLAADLLVAVETFRGRPIRTVIMRNEARHFTECELVDFGCWPGCLSWSEEQVASVERWLVEAPDSRARWPLEPAAEVPEVLRG